MHANTHENTSVRYCSLLLYRRVRGPVVVAVIGGISGSAAGRRRTASPCCRERDLMPAVLVVDECASRSEGIAGGGVDRHREGGCRQVRAIDDL